MHAWVHGCLPVALHAHSLHQRDILLVQVVVVVGHITSLVLENLVGDAHEIVPDGIALTILIPGTLNLGAVGIKERRLAKDQAIRGVH